MNAVTEAVRRLEPPFLCLDCGARFLSPVRFEPRNAPRNGRLPERERAAACDVCPHCKSDEIARVT